MPMTTLKRIVNIEETPNDAPTSFVNHSPPEDIDRVVFTMLQLIQVAIWI